ncbi:CU044_2847 family protein [Micromonospora sp. WMMD967]|uniref:CU044_2847 family protein n=1 Tax=Micromonospora sp. WMMD967 TaxID=3016101 RepID=UPI002415B6F9|nr:CU044_2847 family protein [Micromonospora sp. WMMD967]MDG4838451.1 CU044_2847 family protein [Micromonospora sp. WMMD967]
MSELMQFQTSTGSVVVEIADNEPGFEAVSRNGMVADTRLKLKEAMHDVREAAQEALCAFREGATSPDSIEVEFGVKLNAEAGAIIAKTSTEGHFTVRLSWERPTKA